MSLLFKQRIKTKEGEKGNIPEGDNYLLSLDSYIVTMIMKS